ncbi:GntR family transcriptional regulator [Desulforhopalus singaporensis]|uniref:DNA-binding transcriptional regulator, GntR family n=1 Tax=Desulforhopalus singaporensis TaxID=91360 RepID=A0A1H0UD69_9BACT|nr:GntR family transcriptional regulator [Desulforhopalus singaporensis]SDP64252.1 DNA-binding transcriptional regulator, GntR family [Desulforhopalus singaporensis]
MANPKPKDKVYENLQYRIITNSLKPGDMLNEKDLVEHYRIGRTPLREVLLQLQTENLLQIIPRVGIIVAQIDIQQIKDIIEMRRELEGLAGQMAAERVTGEQLEELKNIYQKLKKCLASENQDVEKLAQYDQNFHHKLYEATQNKTLKSTLLSLNRTTSRFWYHIAYQNNDLSYQFEDLETILEYVEKRDATNARKALTNHLDRVVTKMKNHLF